MFFQGFLVSFDSSFEIDFAKEMNADGSNIAWDNTWANLAIDDSGNIYMSGGYNRCNSATCLYFFDTDNSGNVKKTPSVSSYCGPSSGTFKSYIYVAKINSAGAWQWVKTAGGSTTNAFVYDIVMLNGSAYVSGKLQSCSYSSSSTANFGSYSFTVPYTCWGNLCSSMDRAFIAEISNSGSWNGLMNSSGQWGSTYQAILPPQNIDLNTDGTNLLVAGEYTSNSWGHKFGNFTLPSTGKNSFFAKYSDKFDFIDSFTAGSATDQVRCPNFFNDEGDIWIFAKYEDDFVLDNSSIVRNQKGEIFAKLNSNFSVSEMIDLSGTDAGDCTEISSVGSVEDVHIMQ